MISQSENTSIESKEVKFEIEERKTLSDEEILEIIEINKNSFENENLQLTFDSIKSFLEKESAYVLCVVDSNKKILGYASFLPEQQAQEYLDGRKVFNEPENLYFSELAINPKAKLGLKGFQTLFQKSISVAKEKGYGKLTMHARVKNGLSNIIQKRYKAEFVRVEENFYNSGESFDYLFIVL